MRVALDGGFVRPRVMLAAFRALVYAAGERACRSVQGEGVEGVGWSCGYC